MFMLTCSAISLELMIFIYEGYKYVKEYSVFHNDN